MPEMEAAAILPCHLAAGPAPSRQRPCLPLNHVQRSKGCPVKIAFLGTHGVGKTTLCFDLASRLKRLDMSVDIVKEVARSCPLPINQDTTLDA